MDSRARETLTRRLQAKTGSPFADPQPIGPIAQKYLTNTLLSANHSLSHYRDATTERKEEMIRNLKALGLALVAVFALSAMAASAASALELTASNGLGEHEHALLHAEQVSGEEDVLEITGNTSVKCTTSTATATLATGTASEITVTPSYSGCKAGGTLVTHVEGGQFLLTQGAEVGEDEFTITAHVTEEITLTITNLFQTSSVCTIHIKPQAVPGHAIAHVNTATHDITLTNDFTGLHYTATEGSGVGCLGAPETGENADYFGTTTITAEDTSENPLSLSID